MGRSWFLKLLVVSFSLCLLFSQVRGSLRTLETVKRQDSSSEPVKINTVKGRDLIEVMDYKDPEPNTNPRGYILSPPPK